MNKYIQLASLFVGSAMLFGGPSMGCGSSSAEAAEDEDFGAIILQLHDNFSSHQPEKNGDLVADNVTVSVNGGKDNRIAGNVITGRAAFVQWLQGFKSSFSDAHFEDFDVLLVGSTVAIRFAILGTHDGDFRLPDGTKLPPTGKKISVQSAEFFAFDSEGKIVHIDGLYDYMSLYGQLTQ